MKRELDSLVTQMHAGGIQYEEAVREFKRRFNAGMIGINVGVPAPMAFFPFGGWKNSLYGDLDAQGGDAVAFYTRKKVITEHWFGSEAPKDGWV